MNTPLRTSHAGKRLIVVSNRLPVQIQNGPGRRWQAKESDGGLVSALVPVLSRRGGIWIGWPGTASRAGAAVRAALENTTRNRAYRLVPVSLTAAEVRDFYRGFSNQIVWPLFHDCLNLCNFAPRFWQAYKSANRKFAESIAEIVEPEDLIWVHDYQLMHVAAELRRLGVRNKTGFFNHIPFPTPDVFRRIPWRSEIAGALSEYDLLGFQVPRDEQHFRGCLDEMGSARAGTSRAANLDDRPRSGSFPISIDFEEFENQAASTAVRDRVRQLEGDYPNRQILLGVDRLDYSKGLLEKLAGLKLALERFPELRGRIVLLQYVVPSREKVSEYRNLRLRIERKVGEINGAFSEPGWIPVHYYFQGLDREELCAHYRWADTCLVTSIKDGMNLVAKEYCAAQVGEPGVLVLSEFAGAAGSLKDHALIVNPFDVSGVSDAIRDAFAMPRPERRRRMKVMRAHIREHDVHAWVDRYMAELADTNVDRARSDLGSADTDRSSHAYGPPSAAATASAYQGR